MNIYIQELLNNQYTNIIDLANTLNIQVITPLTEYEKLSFTAITSITKNNKYIMINTNLIKDKKITNFIISYFIAEYLLINKEEYTTKFTIDNLDLETYNLAKKISENINNNKKSDNLCYNNIRRQK